MTIICTYLMSPLAKKPPICNASWSISGVNWPFARLTWILVVYVMLGFFGVAVYK